MKNNTNAYVKNANPHVKVRNAFQRTAEYILSDKRKKEFVDMKKEPEIREFGIHWAESGKTLEDAPNDVKDNLNFINGFNYVKRLQMIKEKEYKRAYEFYNNGGRLKNLSKQEYDKLSDNYIQAYDEIHFNDLMQQGRNFYENGGILELLSDEEREKLDDYFLIGYEDAKMHDKDAKSKNKLR